MIAILARRAAGALGATFLLLGIAAAPATQSAGQPITAGRDTPAGAMNVFEKAIEAGDLATASDSFCVPAGVDPDGSHRRSLALHAMAVRHFADAVQSHFHDADAETILRQCLMRVAPASKVFTDDDFTLMPGETNYAKAKGILDASVPQSRFMTRGTDGIWRMGQGTGAAKIPPRMSALASGMNARMNAHAEHLNEITRAINAGKYTTADAVIHAFWPNGSPAERGAKFAAERQKEAAAEQTRDIFLLPLEVPGALAWAAAEKLSEVRQAVEEAKHWKPSTPTSQTVADAQPPPMKPLLVPAHRDTPAGAMKAYEDALDRYDVAMVSDSFDLPDDQQRHAFALLVIAQRRFYRILEKWYGGEAAFVCFSCAVPRPLSNVAADDWRPVWGHSDRVSGSFIGEPMSDGFQRRPNSARGSDGTCGFNPITWQIGSPSSADDAVSTAAHLNDVSAGVDARRYNESAEVTHAVLYRADVPYVSPTPLTDYVDSGNGDGAYFAFRNAIAARDSAALAGIFHADGDSGGRLVLADAQRIVLTFRLRDAINAKFPCYGTLLIARLGLSTKEDHPEWGGALSFFGTHPSEMTDARIGTHYRIVGGTWKVDVTPAPPQSVAETAARMERDNQSVTAITADVVSGKYVSAAEIRDALLAAHLAARAEPEFASHHYQLPGEAGN